MHLSTWVFHFILCLFTIKSLFFELQTFLQKLCDLKIHCETWKSSRVRWTVSNWCIPLVRFINAIWSSSKLYDLCCNRCSNFPLFSFYQGFHLVVLRKWERGWTHCVEQEDVELGLSSIVLSSGTTRKNIFEKLMHLFIHFVSFKVLLKHFRNWQLIRVTTALV